MWLVGGQVENLANTVVALARGRADVQVTLDDQRLGLEGMSMAFQKTQGFALDQYRRLEALAGELFDEGDLVQGCS